MSREVYIASLPAERARMNEAGLTVRVVPSSSPGRVVFEVGSPRMSLNFTWVVSAKFAAQLGRMFLARAKDAGWDGGRDVE